MVQVGLQVPTQSSWAWHSLTCRVLALPQVDLSALAHSALLVPRHATASLGRRDRLDGTCFAFALRVCVFIVCVCVCVCVSVSLADLTRYIMITG